MRAKCVYCDVEFDVRGLKGHVKMAHPDHFAKWQYGQIDSPSTGTVRKELLKPETMMEEAWYGGLKRRQAHDDAKEMVLADGYMEPMPAHVLETESPPPTPPSEKKYGCSNCNFFFDEPLYDEKGGAYCPSCEEELEGFEDESEL